MAKDGGMGAGGNLYAGLKKRAPMPPSGGTPEKCTVDTDAVRGGTAKTPATIGGRVA